MSIHHLLLCSGSGRWPSGGELTLTGIKRSLSPGDRRRRERQLYEVLQP